MLDLIKSNKSDGELAVINFAIKDMSLKIQWVLMILNDEVIAHIAYAFWDAKYWVIIYGNVICHLFMYLLYLSWDSGQMYCIHGHGTIIMLLNCTKFHIKFCGIIHIY